MRFRIVAVTVLGGLLSVGSCGIQRHGPDQAIYCDLGKTPDGVDIYCPKLVLNGGWPAPFAFDRPGISVEDKIGFPEDDFRFAPFVANFAFYILLLLGLQAILRRISRLLVDRRATPPKGR